MPGLALILGPSSSQYTSVGRDAKARELSRIQCWSQLYEESRRSLERLFRVPPAGKSSSASAKSDACAAAGLIRGLGFGASVGGSRGLSEAGGPAGPPLTCL